MPEELVDLQVIPVLNKSDKLGLSLQGLSLTELQDSDADIVVARCDGTAEIDAVKAVLQPFVS